MATRQTIRDVHVTIKLRNNQLMARRAASGLTQLEVAAAAGINHELYAGLETMRVSPIKRIRDYNCRAPACGHKVFGGSKFCRDHSYLSGMHAKWLAEYDRPELDTWTENAEKLAAFYEVEPAQLFPEALRAIRKTTVVSELNIPQLMQLAGIASGEPTTDTKLLVEGPEREAVRAAVAQALATLSPREERIMRSRYGIDDGADQTHQEIAEVAGVSSKRIAQIENKALRKLRSDRRLWGLGKIG